MKGIPLLTFGLLGAMVFSGCLADSSPPQSAVVRHNGKPLREQVVQIYAHRGGRAIAPENTLPAYASALKQGVDYVDMDVVMAKDGTLVVTHDLTLNPHITRDAAGRFITEKTPIRQLTYDQLTAYDVGKIQPGTEYARFFPDQFGIDGTRMPTLIEVIRYTKSIAGDQVGFQIEIKNDATGEVLTASAKDYAQGLYQILKAEGIINRTEVQAFDFAALLELHRIDPRVKTAFLTDHLDDPSSGADHVLWTAGYKVQDYNNSFPQLVKALGGACWEPYEMDLTKAALDEAHRLGLKVVVWGWPEIEGTAFNQDKIAELIDWGIDGIITDSPDRLRGMLSVRGFNLPPGFVIP